MRKAFSLRIVHCSKMSWCGRLGPAVPTKTSFARAARASRPYHKNFPPVGSGRRPDRCLSAGDVRTVAAATARCLEFRKPSRACASA
jgi:hypothetical protein